MSNKTIVNIFLYIVAVLSLLVAGYSNVFFGIVTLVTLPIVAIGLLYLLEFLEKINTLLPYVFMLILAIGFTYVFA